MVSCVGIPHRSMADDEYRGMFIPKGSVVISNLKYVSGDLLLSLITAHSAQEYGNGRERLC